MNLLEQLRAPRKAPPAGAVSVGIGKLYCHDYWMSVCNLPVFGRPSYLRYRPKRYQCQFCAGHPTTTEHLGWHDANSPHTFALTFIYCCS